MIHPTCSSATNAALAASAARIAHATHATTPHQQALDWATHVNRVAHLPYTTGLYPKDEPWRMNSTQPQATTKGAPETPNSLSVVTKVALAVLFSSLIAGGVTLGLGLGLEVYGSLFGVAGASLCTAVYWHC